MQSKNLNRGALMAATMMQALMGGAPIEQVQARTAEASQTTGQALKMPGFGTRAVDQAGLMRAVYGGLGSGSRGWQRRAGPGWSNRHVQRMAVQAKNIKRHRAHIKG